MVGCLVHQRRDHRIVRDAGVPMLAEVDIEAAVGVDAAGLREGIGRRSAQRARGLSVAVLLFGAPPPDIGDDAVAAAGLLRIVRGIHKVNAIHELALDKVHRQQHPLAHLRRRELAEAPEPLAPEGVGLPRPHLAEHRRQPGLGLRHGRRDLLLHSLRDGLDESGGAGGPVDGGVRARGGEDAEEVGDAEHGLRGRVGAALPAGAVPPAALAPGTPGVPRPGPLQE
mmetsp:Transcript_53197/g.149330  ORF Transcript_53197/g.149330 Transcript_53197/m.149330 type:complete len:226 (-) Transcript_53197:784-1461(-)